MIVDESAINVSGLLAENEELRQKLILYEDFVAKHYDQFEVFKRINKA